MGKEQSSIKWFGKVVDTKSHEGWGYGKKENDGVKAIEAIGFI